jgi:hypothetical protein
MINEIYLIKALNIRKDYLEILNDIDKYEKIAKDLSIVVESRMKDLYVLNDNIKKGLITNVEDAKDKFLNILLKTEEEVNGVDKTIEALNDKLDKLAKDETDLYNEIKSKYIDLSDEKIKTEISNYLNKKGVN